jgi:hypothetical protein
MSCGIVDDIEDILKRDKVNGLDSHIDESELMRGSNKSFIIPKKKIIMPKANQLTETTTKNDEAAQSVDVGQLNSNSNLPEVASIYIKTWG